MECEWWWGCVDRRWEQQTLAALRKKRVTFSNIRLYRISGIVSYYITFEKYISVPYILILLPSPTSSPRSEFSQGLSPSPGHRCSVWIEFQVESSFTWNSSLGILLVLSDGRLKEAKKPNATFMALFWTTVLPIKNAFCSCLVGQFGIELWLWPP